MSRTPTPASFAGQPQQLSGSVSVRLTQTVDQLTHTTIYAYDDAGYRTLTILADDSSIAYAYDDAGRETQQVWYDSLSTAYETLLSVYDDSGLLVSASNSNGTYTFDMRSPPAWRVSSKSVTS